jgi:AhpD family alkylhydroperoxidase
MERTSHSKMARDGIQALSGLDTYTRGSGVTPDLLHLVRASASQPNDCAYCLDVHTKNGRAPSETEQRRYARSLSRETPCYTDRDGAALAWTEAVAVLGGQAVPDVVYADARRHFSDKELLDLTLGLIGIDCWIRLSIAFRTVPGTHRPAPRRKVVRVETLRRARVAGGVKRSIA